MYINTCLYIRILFMYLFILHLRHPMANRLQAVDGVSAQPSQATVVNDGMKRIEDVATEQRMFSNRCDDLRLVW